MGKQASKLVSGRPVGQFTSDELQFALNDLNEVIRIQEDSFRLALKMDPNAKMECVCPKLSTYLDERHYVVEEISRRQGKPKISRKAAIEKTVLNSTETLVRVIVDGREVSNRVFLNTDAKDAVALAQSTAEALGAEVSVATL